LTNNPYSSGTGHISQIIRAGKELTAGKTKLEKMPSQTAIVQHNIRNAVKSTC
jgi:hypothetical protein